MALGLEVVRVQARSYSVFSNCGCGHCRNPARSL